MTCSTSENIPLVFTQGDRVQWTRSFCDYLPTTHAVQYVFRGPSTGFTITGTTNGAAYDFELTSAQTQAMGVGKWQWWAKAVELADTDNVSNICSGALQVYQGAPTSTAAIDNRSAAEIALEAIDAALAGNATSKVQEYEISTPTGSRRVKNFSIKELTDLRTYYATIVSRERFAASNRAFSTIQVRMPGC